MKKIIITALCFAIAVTTTAQEPKDTTAKAAADTLARKPKPEEYVIPHLKFKGVPITGTVEQFKGSLSKKGMRNYSPRLTYGANGLKEEYMAGSFSGKEILAYIGYSPLSRTVYGVFALFPSWDNWESAYNDYLLFKKHLMAVYGEPSTTTEMFIDPYRKGDGYSIKALNENKCKYRTAWHTFEGVVSIEIVPSGDNAQVIISYTDAIGSEINESENTRLIENDL